MNTVLLRFNSIYCKKKGKRKVQGVPQSQTAALLTKGDCKVQILALEIITPVEDRVCLC